MILRSLLMMDLPPSDEPERSGDGLAAGGTPTPAGGPAGLRGSIGAGSVAGLRVHINFIPRWTVSALSVEGGAIVKRNPLKGVALLTPSADLWHGCVPPAVQSLAWHAGPCRRNRPGRLNASAAGKDVTTARRFAKTPRRLVGRQRQREKRRQAGGGGRDRKRPIASGHGKRHPRAGHGCRRARQIRAPWHAHGHGRRGDRAVHPVPEVRRRRAGLA